MVRNAKTKIIQTNLQGNGCPKKSLFDDKFGIGFEMYSIEGKKGVDRRLPKAVFSNDGGYKVTNAVSYEGSIKDTGSEPLTALITTF